MGHHITPEGKFQSDKYPFLKPDQMIFSFHDGAARVGFKAFALVTKDRELAEDMLTRIRTIQENDA